MWEIDTVNQIETFIFALVLGCLCGLVYCIFHSASKFSGKIFVLNLFDFFFWLICALLNFLFFLSRTNGEIRIFVIAAEIIGFCILYFTFGSKIIRLFLKILQLISALGNVFLRFMQFLCEKTLNFALKCFKKLKKLLKNIGHLLYTVFYKDKQQKK